MNRKKFIQQTSLASAGLLLGNNLQAFSNREFPVVRTALANRKFSSPAVETLISHMKNIGNKEIAWLFENCFPNTLDTTVDFEMINGKPDTFVITGDIDAMWLRDSTAQVWPYLPLMKQDSLMKPGDQLQQLIKGVINRQTKCILKDPYANAFYKDETKISEWKDDKTLMKPGIHERKWEIDSLCYPIRLAHAYVRYTGDRTVLDHDWLEAMRLVLKTFRQQQRIEDNGPYKFERTTSWATDGVPLGGFGYPAKKIGLIHSMFRPSDDATVFPFNIPANYMAADAMERLSELCREQGGIDIRFANECHSLAKNLRALLAKFAFVQHNAYGKIMAYEVNGYGSYNLMDDANVPSLLSLPYLFGEGFGTNPQYAYMPTRKYLLSPDNPFFFKGSAGEGIGGPHVGIDYIWPLSIIMRGLTSDSDLEIKQCLDQLVRSNAGTGFMHEAFHKHDVTKFTRKWFAWANTLFGEFVWKVYQERKHLLQ